MRALKGVIDTVVVPLCRRVSILRSLVTYVSEKINPNPRGYSHFNDDYNYLKSTFIKNGEESKWDKTIRGKIIEKFEVIDRSIQLATTPTDSLFMAEVLLSLEVDGELVECGCYAGGSTAKLSILAGLLGKKLFIYDSFEGLPIVDPYNKRDFHVRRSSQWFTGWVSGGYSASLEHVKENIRKYGEISVCSFHKGWFSNTLKKENLPTEICFAFTDVDIASSARECFTAIWPRMLDGGIYFSHDVAYIKVLQAIMDESLWREIFREFPPIIFGAGYGLGDSSPHLGFMIKGKSITPEYIKTLAIEK